jgi:hypothetical protein
VHDEAVCEVTAVQELVRDLGDDGSQVAVMVLKVRLVDGEKGVKMPSQRRGLGLPVTVDLMRHAPQCNKRGVSSNGIPLKTGTEHRYSVSGMLLKLASDRRPRAYLAHVLSGKFQISFLNKRKALTGSFTRTFASPHQYMASGTMSVFLG